MIRLIFLAVTCVTIIQAKNSWRISDPYRKTDAPLDDEETYSYSGNDVILENVIGDNPHIEFDKNTESDNFEYGEPLMLQAAPSSDYEEADKWDVLNDFGIYYYYEENPVDENEAEGEDEKTTETATASISVTVGNRTDIEPEATTTSDNISDVELTASKKAQRTNSVTSTSLNEKRTTPATIPATDNVKQQTTAATESSTKRDDMLLSHSTVDESHASRVNTESFANAETTKSSVPLTTRSNSKSVQREKEIVHTTDDIDVSNVDEDMTTTTYHKVLSTETGIADWVTGHAIFTTLTLIEKESSMAKVTSKLPVARPTKDLISTSRITTVPAHASKTTSLTITTKHTPHETTNPTTVSLLKQTLTEQQPTRKLLTPSIPPITSKRNNIDPDLERSTESSVVIPRLVTVTQKTTHSPINTKTISAHKDKAPKTFVADLPVTQVNEQDDNAPTTTVVVETNDNPPKDQPRKASISTIILIICLISLLIVVSLVAIVIIIVRARVRRRGKYEITSDIDSAEGVAAGVGQGGDRKAVVTVQYNDSHA